MTRTAFTDNEASLIVQALNFAADRRAAFGREWEGPEPLEVLIASIRRKLEVE